MYCGAGAEMARAMAGKVLVAWLLAAAVLRVEANHKIMTDITLGFGQALEHCREESGLTEDRMEEFFHVWDKSFQFSDRSLGCALQCMSRYFNLLTDENRLHHQNTENFIRSFPNGELLAEQLVVLIHGCVQQFEHDEDHCMRTLHVAECIRDACVNRQLAPTMEMLLAEFIMQAES